MRRTLRAGVTLTAAAVVMLALSGASFAGAADVVQPHVFRASFVIPAFREVPRALTDSQLVAAEAPERAVLAAKARALAEARARAAAAARVAAARAAAAQRASTSGLRVASYSSSGHTLNVWTYGFQAQVNACRGGVDLTGAYHVRTVGEHWSCGGSSFPETPGSIVTLTGIDAGKYRVIGLVATLDAYTAKTNSIPRGYQLLFQTCRGGNSHSTIFIALARA